MIPEPFRKRMVVARPIGKYANGDDEGVMDAARLRRIATAFKKYPRQVPIYALGDHVESYDDRLPDGWVESLDMDGDEMVIEAKLHGEAVTLVSGDLVRGASIGTVQGKNPDGTSQGEVLHHVLLTNNPFIKGLNIAAANAGGETVASFFTAITKEATVAKEEVELTKLKEENAALHDEVAALKATKPDERVEATEALLRDATRKVSELTAANANLIEEVSQFKKNPQLETALSQMKAMERQVRAAKIRRLVGKGVSAGQFTLAHVGEPTEGWDHQSDEGVLAWFKASVFGDDVSKVEFGLATFDKKAHSQTYRSGAPQSGEAAALSADDKAFVKSLGMDPEAVAVGMAEISLQDFKAQTSQKKGA